ncbi:hypothetical protein HELRODRAFT_175898 [Helobdella robusta]|uniref:Uncharacterized protein n=1 Tax=Helobdella robusta TaxID=6412 RepID=T1F9U8_HELRO|nr:hypothetical protein HELRODRAFT_175898 [Helobdella robusta]ESO00462.1 hypothetical protein HELRODRAFT_175898 [Helobdella robusta]
MSPAYDGVGRDGIQSGNSNEVRSSDINSSRKKLPPSTTLNRGGVFCDDYLLKVNGKVVDVHVVEAFQFYLKICVCFSPFRRRRWQFDTLKWLRDDIFPEIGIAVWLPMMKPKYPSTPFCRILRAIVTSVIISNLFG